MKRRQAFTLVELMVSMALIIFMMAILSQAFVAGLNTFRNLKAQGDLAEKLRSTSQILQHDLAANHFEGNRRISDPTFWNNGPPQQGFFQIFQGPAANPAGTWLGTSPVVPGFVQVYQGNPILGSFPEGADPLGIPSYRTINHALSFTVRLVGNDMGDFMSSSAIGSGNTGLVPQLPLGIGSIPTFGPPESRYQPIVSTLNVTGYNSQWAAVAWFLAPQLNLATGQQDTTVPDPTAGTPAAFPLYQLYRRQCLLVPDNNLVTLATMPLTMAVGQPLPGVPSGLIGNFLEMSCIPDPNKASATINFNSPRDITMPANRGTTATSMAQPTVFTPIGLPSGWGGQPIYTPIPQGSLLTGSDIQLNDVVSFDVRVLPLYPLGYPQSRVDPFVTLSDSFFTTIFPNYTAPPGPLATGYVFDTWSSISNGINDYSAWNVPGVPGESIPFWTLNPVTYHYPVGTLRTLTLPGFTTMFGTIGTSAKKQATGSGPIILAIQITIRIWDFKTNQTRQVTIVQAM